MVRCKIISVCADFNWHTIGTDRDDADRNWRNAIEIGLFPRPLYRVVVRPKASR